jgi:hypothetical protein
MIVASDLPDLPTGFVVRLLGPDGQPVGVGVLVGQREIVTCAHVVNASSAGRRRLRTSRASRSPSSPRSLRARVTRGRDWPRGWSAGSRPRGRGPRATTSAGWCSPPPSCRRARPRHGWRPTRRRRAAAGRGPGTAGGQPAAWAGSRGVRLPRHAPTPGRRVGGGYRARPSGGGRLQLDSTTEAALRVQPGFSGSPVWDRSVSRVVGLLAAAPLPGAGARDSYAIPAERLRRAWPEVLDPRGTTMRASARAGTREAGGGVAELTVLHVSDPQ